MNWQLWCSKQRVGSKHVVCWIRRIPSWMASLPTRSPPPGPDESAAGPWFAGAVIGQPPPGRLGSGVFARGWVALIWLGAKEGRVGVGPGPVESMERDRARERARFQGGRSVPGEREQSLAALARSIPCFFFSAHPAASLFFLLKSPLSCLLAHHLLTTARRLATRD